MTVFAVVRDHQGRPITGLTSRDFDLVDSGQHRPIIDCRVEQGPITRGDPRRRQRQHGGVGETGGGSRDGQAPAQLVGLRRRPGGAVYVRRSIARAADRSRPITARSESRLDALRSVRQHLSLRCDLARWAWNWLAGPDRGAPSSSSPTGRTHNSRLSAAEAARVVRLVDVPVYIIAVDPAPRIIRAQPVADSLKRPRAGHGRGILRHERTCAHQSGGSPDCLRAPPSVSSLPSSRAPRQVGIRSPSARSTKISSCGREVGIWRVPTASLHRL